MRRTKEEAEQTRLKIIDAALVLFSRNGYTNTTLANIATQAGFSRGPIYWHFKNKDELFEAVLLLSQGPLLALTRETHQAEGPPLEVLSAFADRWLRLLVEDTRYRQSFEIFLNKTELTNNLDHTLRRERKLTRDLVSALGRQVARAQQAGDIPRRHGAEELGLLCYTHLMGVTQTWLFSPRLFRLEEEIPFFTGRLIELLKL
ncbi:MAG: TetR family transcriptional regulator [Alcanivorax sp.]|uniref:TetR family transcriptional regulator n=1 Tax=Alloalcanivorax marinus TaxID=1177169 RepID=UPI00195EB9DC|nr:TetR family transcriptional regulator [Alloalcanivorax marinus]MBM7333305.1 TetR family transcriptional regulator [Alloalcanivorax marinus]